MKTIGLVHAIFLFLTICWATTLHAQSTSRPTDRARITVQSVPDALGGGKPLKVLRTDASTPLRAGAVWLFKAGTVNDERNATAKDPAFYRKMRAAGLNAVRLIQFEVWFQSDAPEKTTRYTDFTKPKECAALLANIETVINLASAEGLYVILNAHTKLRSYDDAYTRAFWTVVAPQFKDRTHVIYELTNEPLGDLANYYENETFLDQQQSLYSLVRGLAPATHQQLLSVNGIWARFGGEDVLKMVADKFEARKPGNIDWRNTSVAYHLYYNGHTSARLRALHAAYPGFSGENNFAYDGVVPSGVREDDTARSESMDVPFEDRTRFANETCERLGIGWAHWHLENHAKFDANWPLLRADAEAKGYLWTRDPVKVR